MGTQLEHEMRWKRVTRKDGWKGYWKVTSLADVWEKEMLTKEFFNFIMR